MIYKSPHPEVAIPEVPLVSWVMEKFDEYGDRPALVEGESGRTITYHELRQRIQSLAAGLQADPSLAPGDVLTIYAPNSPEYAIAALGVSLAGLVFTTANPLYTEEELARQLADSGARRLFTIRAFSDKASAAAARVGIPAPVIFGEDSFESLFGDPAALRPATPDVRNDTAGLLYSSGTTGVAKGVMMTHYNMVAACAMVHGVEPMRANDTIVNFLPFFHIYGLQIILNCCLRRGITLVTMGRFDLETYLRLTQQYRPSRAYMVPPVVIAFAKSPLIDRYDLSSLESIMTGAAPLGEEVAQAVQQRLGIEVRQGYGMTETSTIITTTPTKWKRDSLDSVGAPVPNMAMRLVDPVTLTDVAPGERGEVWCTGPNIMKGYLNRPDATAEMITPDGWLRTGDIGVVGTDGNLRIVDRVKELIKFKGLQVAPAELEALLLGHPSIADCAVIGVRDEEAGEIPLAFVVRRDPALTEQSVMDYVAGQVAPHKRVRRVEFCEQIPKSPSGKILRRLLRDQFAAL